MHYTIKTLRDYATQEGGIANITIHHCCTQMCQGFALGLISGKSEYRHVGSINEASSKVGPNKTSRPGNQYSLSQIGYHDFSNLNACCDETCQTQSHLEKCAVTQG